MARRALTNDNDAIKASTLKVGDKFQGVLTGVRAIKFGQNRDGTPDMRFIADFVGVESDFSFWLPTQLRNLLVDVENGNLLVKRFSILWLTYQGTRPTKGGGNDTHIFEVEIDDDNAEQGVDAQLTALIADKGGTEAPTKAKAEEPKQETRELVTAGRGGSGNGRSRR